MPHEKDVTFPQQVNKTHSINIRAIRLIMGHSEIHYITLDIQVVCAVYTDLIKFFILCFQLEYKLHVIIFN